MTSAAAKPRWLDWLPVIGMLITLAGLIWTGAQVASTVADNTRRISALETRADAMQQIDVRLARIEGQLELMRRDRDK